MNNFLPIFAKEIKKLIKHIAQMEVQSVEKNNQLNNLVVKIENTLQQYEFLQSESELICKKISSKFSQFNEKLFKDISNLKKDDFSKELISNFFYLLTGSPTIPSNEDFRKLTQNINAILSLDVNKEIIEHCLQFYLGIEQAKTKTSETTPFSFLTDLYKALVDHYVKKSLLRSLYDKNIKKNNKLQELRDCLNSLDEKVSYVAPFIGQMEKELRSIEGLVQNEHFDLAEECQLTLIQKYNLLEKYKVIVLSEGEQFLIKMRSKYKNFSANIDFLISSITSYQSRKYSLKFIENAEHMKKSRNQMNPNKIIPTDDKGIVQNTEFLEKMKTNYISVHYKENLKPEPPQSRISQNIFLQESNEKQAEAKIHHELDIPQLSSQRSKRMSRTNSMNKKRDTNVQIEGKRKSNCFWCC